MKQENKKFIIEWLQIYLWPTLSLIILIIAFVYLIERSNIQQEYQIYKEECFERVLLENTKFDRLTNHNFSIVRDQFQDNTTQEYRFILTDNSLSVNKISCFDIEQDFLILYDSKINNSQINENWLDDNTLCFEKDNILKEKCIVWSVNNYIIKLK